MSFYNYWTGVNPLINLPLLSMTTLSTVCYTYFATAQSTFCSVAQQPLSVGYVILDLFALV